MVNYPADYVEFRQVPPTQVDGDGTRHWHARGQNFVVAYIEPGTSGARLQRRQPDEWMLLLPAESARVQVTVGAAGPAADGGVAAEAHGQTLLVVPAGAADVQIGDGPAVAIFSSQAADLLALAVNAGSYAAGHLGVAPFQPWPAPGDGPRIRSYPLNVPVAEGRLGRIWRCSTLMVNVGVPRQGPRDDSRLSPHSHDDFEQGSLTLAGEYIHHLRWPWSADRGAWREDEHRACGSPSLTIIPPPAVHTSQAVGAAWHQLVDIFAPPRLDFSQRPGWVLNAAEYPMPPG